jgi:hypothetical protein
MKNKVDLVAFTGYAGAGKDVAAEPLIAAGYSRRCFGDIIKGQIDPLIQKYLGFSAFTENRVQKAVIRPLLETWGEANYDSIMEEFFDTLPERAVNTRLCRTREAEEWVARGGKIFEVRRPRVGPATDWERNELASLRRAGLIYDTIDNDATVDNLHDLIKRYFRL